MKDSSPVYISSKQESLSVDLEAVRDKYRAERERRITGLGSAQFLEVSGDLAHFEEVDPYAEGSFTREAIDEVVEVVVIGGGFSGMLAAARLKESGVSDLRIIEAASDFGGTWYWNRYPGVRCDIESYCHIPLLEELDYVPKEKYSPGAEIFEHCKNIGEHYDLYTNALFQTRVREVRWDEGLKRWQISTNHGDHIRARFVVMGLGTTNRPKLPGIEGIDSFRGKMFHTSRWDYGYTGGDVDGRLTKLSNKRVAIIGTGASAVQAIPHLAASAQHLFVFQRTPSSVDARGNKPTDQEWANSLKPGWQKARREHFSDVVEGKPVDEDLIQDGWTHIFRNVMRVPDLDIAGASSEEVARRIRDLMEVADFEQMNSIRARIDESVEDKGTAEKLKPWYRQMCKRPTFSDDYLPAFNRKNVTLIDTSPMKGVERITKSGVVANGVEYAVDCIIFATGFEIVSEIRRRIGFDVFGRNERSLNDYYRTGLRTFHGHSTRGFPNWFYLGFSQNAVSINVTAALEDQSKHIAYIISTLRDLGATTVEPSLAAEEGWVQVIRDMYVVDDGGFQANCTPGYYNAEGVVPRSAIKNGTIFTGGVNEFNALLRVWRDEGKLEGLQIGFS
ncbi:flavin-containing monooxygenase [Caballeronia sp. 15711]|uniref:flavin-containing monooxygenase n=1 Tax=Caballeronia sp. 15711 TaxID=3391029 RepID=UPI0039E40B39